MKNELFILILQNLVLFPNQEVKLELNNTLSRIIINKSLDKFDGDILIVSPKNELEIRPEIEDLPPIVTFANVKNSLILPNGNMRATIRGIKRVKIKKYHMDEDLIRADTESLRKTEYNKDKEETYIRKLKKRVNEYIGMSNTSSNSLVGIIKNVSSLTKLTDILSASLELNYQDKWKLLNEENAYERAKWIMGYLANEIASLKYDKKLDDEVRNKFEKKEKEIYIKEKIDLLSKELGTNDIHEECKDYIKRIKSFNISPKVKEDLKHEVERLESTSESSPEYGMIRAHLDFVIDLPWNKESKDKTDIKAIDKYLNETHYGLENAKLRIEEYLMLKTKSKDIQSPILCLVGPPGTGKTTFARELAKSIGREFVKISVGGLNDSAELIGHRRTYIGSGPGKIMEGIKKSGVNNPVILIDEIDKMVKDYKGDPASVLLDILDQNQNKEFRDNYVSEPFDLSRVIFILTANDDKSIPAPLLDRLEIIETQSYTIFDKIEIAKNYTMPRLSKEYHFKLNNIVINDNILSKIINDYTKESGVRDLERKLAQVVRKVLITSKDKVVVKEEDLPKYLGTSKYSHYVNKYSKSGTVNVPAFTMSGGRIINIECSIYAGKENVIVTGLIGPVMQESVQIAISYIKKNGKSLKVNTNLLSGTVHIHALEASTKKEGSSAGLAITMAIVSQMLDRRINNDIAFTGEMSLEGRILEVGGIKEKIVSCYNQGIKTVYIPMGNIKDLESIPKKVLSGMSIIPVNDFMEVYKQVFN